MPEPFRLRVLKALTATLEGITPANGYDSNMAGRVFRGRTVYGEDDPLPMLSILEPPIPLETILATGNKTGSSGDWELLIQGFVEDDHQNPSDPAHKLMAEVKKVLVVEKERNRGQSIFGIGYGRQKNGIVEMHIGQGAVRPADQSSSFTFFWLTLTLKLAEDQKNPFDV